MSAIADIPRVLIKACRCYRDGNAWLSVGDNIAFAPEEIGKAIVHALKQECNLSYQPTS
jgi:hypothetical protein